MLSKIKSVEGQVHEFVENSEISIFQLNAYFSLVSRRLSHRRYYEVSESNIIELAPNSFTDLLSHSLPSLGMLNHYNGRGET